MMRSRMVLALMAARGLAVLVALLLVCAPNPAEAQPAGKGWRIGVFTPAELPWATLIGPLRELGSVDGRTARFEFRSAQNDRDRLPELATDLVRTSIDIIVAVSPPAIIAAKRATPTTPIVMAFWGGDDLIESGVVASFPRPGGNVTGVYMLAAELDAKRLELLLQAVPKSPAVALLNPGPGWSLDHLQHLATTHRIQLLISAVPGPDGNGPAFAAMSKAKADAVLVPSFPRFFREHLSIVNEAAKRR